MATAKRIDTQIKLITSIPMPALIAIGVRVKNSMLPNECTRKSTISAMAKAQPCTNA